MKLKKGSPEAKRFMAKIRAMKSGTKKKATKKVTKKKSLGATKFFENNIETKSSKPKRNISVTRRIDGTFKKFDDSVLQARRLRKKALAKKQGRKINGLHKDTKSHNVRISVMSGIKDDTLKDLYYKSNYNQKLIEILNNLKIELKNKHNSNLIKTNLKKDIMQVKKNILSNKNAISNLKKLI